MDKCACDISTGECQGPAGCKAIAEIERLRGHLHQHFAFARFVHLWTNRDNVTDAERVSVIKNHPSLRKVGRGRR